MNKTRAAVAKSLLAGCTGGIAGAWAMRRFSAAWRKVGGLSDAPAGEPYSSQEWDSAAGAAEMLATVFAGRRLSAEGKRRGAAVVHYAVGGLAGAIYALAAQPCPALRAGSGAGFGFAFWLFGDELAMPRLGLNAPRSHYSLPMQLNSLGEHLVYGFTAEQVRRVLQRW
jgi:hypothetical protein